jgi:serine phosphatase RsbU (regulator of sigma subunit)
MSLRAKLILSFTGVVLLTWLFALVLSYDRMRDSFREGLRGSLQDLASGIAASIDGDLIGSIASSADEQRPEYRAEREKLIRTKSRLPDVRYLYVYKPSSEPGQVQMIVGGEPFDADEKEVTRVEPYDASKAPSMLAGFAAPSADPDVIEDEYGVWLSGYAPVYDSAGRTVGAVGLDYPASSIRAQERQLLWTLALSSALALVAALGVGYALARVITRPLLELVRATDTIAGGDLKASVSIERSDEIGALARAFNKMVRNLGEMAAALQGYTTQAVQSKELEVAARLQRSLVPQHGLAAPGVSVASALRNVEFGGGTTYDYFLFGQDSYLIFDLGRVEAIGLEATSVITVAKSTLSALVSNCVFRPQELGVRLGQSLAEVAPGKRTEYLCGVYDVAQGWLTVLNAGHAYPYLFRPESGELMQLDHDSGPPLGTDPQAGYNDFDLKLERGDVLVAYSSGVPALESPAGEPYGLERFEEAIRRGSKLDPEALKDALLDELLAYHGPDTPLQDDLALLVVRFDGPPEA